MTKNKLKIISKWIDQVLIMQTCQQGKYLKIIKYDGIVQLKTGLTMKEKYQTISLLSGQHSLIQSNIKYKRVKWRKV